MITKHPWFGPKRIGWGWRPVSWEGWAITALIATVVVAASILFGYTPMTVYFTIGAVLALALVCSLTGTPPG